jgi:RNA polymerase sigma factor (sigma-70 family)
MNETIDLNDFNAVARQYYALMRLKVRQFVDMNPSYARRLESDLLQEALIALWRAAKTYDGRVPFYAYAAILIERRLFRYIEFRHHLRCEKPIENYPVKNVLHYDDPTYSCMHRDMFEYVMRIAEKILTRRQYLCLRYRYLSKPHDLTSFADVAKRLRCNVEAAKSLCYEALFKLRVAFNVPTKRKTTYVNLKPHAN